jgi:hypothetical protein
VVTADLVNAPFVVPAIRGVVEVGHFGHFDNGVSEP